jgi:hypothetical protein
MMVVVLNGRDSIQGAQEGGRLRSPSDEDRLCDKHSVVVTLV